MKLKVCFTAPKLCEGRPVTTPCTRARVAYGHMLAGTRPVLVEELHGQVNLVSALYIEACCN